MEQEQGGLLSSFTETLAGYLNKKSFREALKKVWNFTFLSGVGGFEKIIFHKNKKYGLKMPKID